MITSCAALGKILLSVYSEHDNCNFYMRFIYGTEVFLIFNLAALVGYKVFRICYDMYEFAYRGNLPSAETLRCQNGVIMTIWVTSVLIPLTYMLLSIYWLIINEDWNI